jgi:diacylglycerol kinase (ATP)
MLLFNPQSGSGRHVEAIRGLAADRPWLTLAEAGDSREATRLTRQGVKDGCTTVIAAGGDGTVHAVVNGLADQFERARLGVLPAGSANDFARTLAMPLDLGEAMAAIETGHETRVDVVQARTAAGDQRYFINAATGGFSTLMGQKLDDQTKSRFGGWAYLVAGLKALPEAPRYEVTLTVDGQTLVAEAGAVVVANGRSAGGLELVPDADPGDGVVDVLLVTAQGLAEHASLLAQYVVNRHLESEAVIRRRGRVVQLQSNPPVPFRIDGEELPSQAVRFEVLPRAVRLLAPAA